MISKNKISFIRSLQLKKNREQAQMFIAEGLHIVEEILSFQIPCQEVFVDQHFIQYWNKPLPENAIEVSTEIISRLSALRSNPHAVAVLPYLSPAKPETLPDGPRLVLDKVQDPGNLGTILRLADWFGIPCLYCSPECADIYNPKTIQASMGSVFRVKVIRTDLQQLLEKSTVPVYMCTLHGNSLFTFHPSLPCFIVLGSEGQGISSNLLQLKHIPVTIPSGIFKSANQLSKSQGPESLNVAMAAAAFLSKLADKKTSDVSSSA